MPVRHHCVASTPARQPKRRSAASAPPLPAHGERSSIRNIRARYFRSCPRRAAHRLGHRPAWQLGAMASDSCNGVVVLKRYDLSRLVSYASRQACDRRPVAAFARQCCRRHVRQCADRLGRRLRATTGALWSLENPFDGVAAEQTLPTTSRLARPAASRSAPTWMKTWFICARSRVQTKEA